MNNPWIAVIDYGMGNLFSVLRACDSVGLDARLTTTADDVAAADGVILPGVGAFPDGMRELAHRGLIEPLQKMAGTRKPFFGICLGMQFMMTESSEFGRTAGLGLIEGSVVQLESPHDGDEALKVPEVGWNTISRPESVEWHDTPLADVEDGTPFYFVHSFFAVPVDRSVVTSVTRYGQIEFCSSLAKQNLFGCQFHPERSGANGLAMYRSFANMVMRTRR